MKNSAAPLISWPRRLQPSSLSPSSGYFDGAYGAALGQFPLILRPRPFIGPRPSPTGLLVLSQMPSRLVSPLAPRRVRAPGTGPGALPTAYFGGPDLSTGRPAAW